MSAEGENRYLGRGARTRRRLLEQQGDALTAQDKRYVRGIELPGRGAVEERRKLSRVEVVDLQEAIELGHPALPAPPSAP